MKLFKRAARPTELPTTINSSAREVVRQHLGNPDWDIDDGLTSETVEAINRKLRDDAVKEGRARASRFAAAGQTIHCTKCGGTNLSRRFDRGFAIGHFPILMRPNIYGRPRDRWDLVSFGQVVTEAITVTCACGYDGDIERPADWNEKKVYGW
ncbi:hypothetical protein [Nocardia wallacei]|uniref:hypothetical protein n=1 Tax=Nocardia wallacei TaxID=480035 RepID=UPI002454DA01|nr:hypothetical protein [Nocardia wallacei]